MTTIRRSFAITGLLGLAVLMAGSAISAPKKGYIANIEALTERNQDFRRVLYTGKHMQLVVMTIRPGEDIGEEVHDSTDQFFRIEKGEGELRIDGVASRVRSDDAFIVPAGASHNVVNTGKAPLKLYTIYAPPEHRDGIARATRAEAHATDAHFDGKTTE
ncbi:MAG TPA: cupin domain-containing protein [Hyphomicrobiaceae bacterium]|jgi:mannose-6-phosphate isomerase-like protein (cupin superfamily)